ncbi:MAG: AAA domain-containing protein, partial [Anaerolineae bacterium]|nr:AAA domain-containing protein [Anaerolineae bacterium]
MIRDNHDVDTIIEFGFDSIHQIFDITIETVDSIQGQEADIVILCFTKAKEKAFYNVNTRLNVALT